MSDLVRHQKGFVTTQFKCYTELPLSNIFVRSFFLLSPARNSLIFRDGFSGDGRGPDPGDVNGS